MQESVESLIKESLHHGENLFWLNFFKIPNFTFALIVVEKF